MLRVRGIERDAADAAITDAFRLAERLHELMSRQSPSSDLAEIARLRPGESVHVAPETCDALSFALAMAEDTEGLFDPTTPGPAGRDADWRDLTLTAAGEVRVRRSVSVSLDGVAKGFAADRLAAMLRDAGAAEVIVDAGGDLALACEAPQAVGVRDPSRPGANALVLHVASGGVASSAGYGGISELWPRGAAAAPWPCAVTVRAPDCATADALTKVVALDPGREDILTRWRAEAHVASCEGAA